MRKSYYCNFQSLCFALIYWGNKLRLMFNYQKTQLGLDALQQRTRDLNARQRRLLVLIGTEDFDLLGDWLKQRLAPPELIEQLLGMQLIAPAALEQDTLQHQEQTANILLQQEQEPSSTTLTEFIANLQAAPRKRMLKVWQIQSRPKTFK